MAVDDVHSVPPPSSVPTTGLDLARLASGRTIEARVASLAEGLALVTTRHGTLQVDLAAFGRTAPALGDVVRLQVQPAEGGGRPTVTVVEPAARAAEPAAAAGEDPVLVLARAVRGAAANQSGLAPLYATLEALKAAPAASVPAPVRALVDQMMATRLADGRPPTAEAVKRAFLGSGLFLETRLATSAQATAAPADDLKAALFALRAALGRWVGSAAGGAAAVTTPVAAGRAATPSGDGARAPALPSGGGTKPGADGGLEAPRPGSAAAVTPSAGAVPERGPVGRLIGATYGGALGRSAPGGPVPAGDGRVPAGAPRSVGPGDPPAGRTDGAIQTAPAASAASAYRAGQPVATTPPGVGETGMTELLPGATGPRPQGAAVPGPEVSTPASGLGRGEGPATVTAGSGAAGPGGATPGGTATSGGVTPPGGAATQVGVVPVSGPAIRVGAASVGSPPAPSDPRAPMPPDAGGAPAPVAPGGAGGALPGASASPIPPRVAIGAPGAGSPAESPPFGMTSGASMEARGRIGTGPSDPPVGGGTAPPLSSSTAAVSAVGNGTGGAPAGGVTVPPTPGATTSPLPSVPWPSSGAPIGSAVPMEGPAGAPVPTAPSPGGTPPAVAAPAPGTSLAPSADGRGPLGPGLEDLPAEAAAAGLARPLPAVATPGGAPGAGDGIATLLAVVVRGLGLVGGLTPSGTREAAEAAAALEALSPDRELRPPPPRRGQAPRGQAAMAAERIGDDGVEGVARQALERTEGALSRILLEQFAALDKRDDPGRPSDLGARREWTAEMPIATRDGTAIVQMAVARDGGRGRGEAGAAKPSWRVRFSMDVEPLGPVHAQIGFSGERLAIGLWVERPDAAARLGGAVGRLEGALAAAAIPVESIRLATGRPASEAPIPTAGRLVDVKL